MEWSEIEKGFLNRSGIELCPYLDEKEDNNE